MTRRQSNNQWSGGITAHPVTPQNIQSAKILWKISRLDFMGSRRYSPHWLFSKWPNYQHGVLLVSAGAIEGHFEGKAPREDRQNGMVLARQCPSSPGTCNPEVTGPLSFQYHDHPPYSPDLPLSHYHRFPGLKKQLIGRHFSSDAEVIVAAETWLDGRGEFGCLLWETCGIQQQAVWTKCWDSFVTAVFLSCCINCTSICYRNFNGQYNCPTLLCRRSIFNLDCATAGT